MPVPGFRDHWAAAMSCSLNLAGCRLRAESLARQLHSNLWSRSNSPGDSGSVSPCGFGAPPLLVVDRPPSKWRMSSLDDDDDSSGSTRVSPPCSPLHRIALLHKNGTEIYGNGQDASPLWRPDSPPESLSSDSPALTLEMEDPTPDDSTETASPPDDDAAPLAEELRSRLQLIQERPGSPSDSSTSTMDLLSPDACGPRLVRSTSLKTGKTPPGTPSRKKIVRFADALGLDLEAVRHFAKDDDAPIVPQSAFADLRIPTSSSAPLLLLTSWGAASPSGAACELVAQFAQPAGEPRFLERVRQQKVSLENIILNDLKIIGVVRVLNLGFQKALAVRYTTSEWAAHADLSAEYVPNSCDGFSDKFSFQLHLPHLSAGQRILFALRYSANGQQFWDNNGGDNYVLRCQTKAADQEAPRWLHHHFM